MNKLAIAGLLVTLLGTPLLNCCCNDACSDEGDTDSAGVSAGDEGESESETTTTTSDSPPPTSNLPTTTTDCPQIPTGGQPCEGDSSPPDQPCDVWEQDCADGYKCVPYDSDSDGERDATACVPVSNDAQEPGGHCAAGDLPLDDCNAGSLCLVPGIDPGAGYCAALCTMDNPSCGGGEICLELDEDLLALCMTPCDPFAPVCPTGTECYPMGPDLEFVCWPSWDGSGAGGEEGTPCGIDHGCQPGLTCVDAESLPEGCFADDCCVRLCDGDPSSTDFDCEAGDVCIPFVTDQPQETAGACSTPG